MTDEEQIEAIAEAVWDYGTRSLGGADPTDGPSYEEDVVEAIWGYATRTADSAPGGIGAGGFGGGASYTGLGLGL